MCITFKNKPNKMRAKRRIPIVKYCRMDNGIIYSWYQGEKYVLHKEYHTVLQQIPYETPYKTYALAVGFHSYNKNVVHYNSTLPIDYTLMIRISLKGLFLDFLRLSDAGIIVKVYGYIPKGAEYFKNDIGEYISDKIVLTNYEEVVYNTNQKEPLEH